MKNIRLTEKGMKVIIILIVILLISYLIYIPFKSKGLNTQQIADLTNSPVYGSDYYKPVSKEVMQDFLNDFNYEGKMNCVWVAFTFQVAVRNKFGNVAVGVATNSTHMFNFFIDKNNELYFIEAQSTKVKGIYPKQHHEQGSLSFIIL